LIWMRATSAAPTMRRVDASGERGLPAILPGAREAKTMR
jgi:hypothetical protein